MTFPVKNKITLGFIVSVGALLFTGWFSYRTTTNLVDTLDRVAHSHEVIATLEAGTATLTDAETAQRGFLLTGDEAFLADCLRAQQRGKEWLANLQQLTADNPDQQRHIAALADLIEQRMAVMNNRIAIRQREGLEAAARAVATREGKNLMDQVRAMLLQIKNAEQVLLTQWEQTARTRTHVSIIVIGSSCALAIIVGTLAFVVIRHDLRRREAAELALQESRTLLESILDHTPAVVFIKDLAGRYLFVNRRFAEIAGRARTEIHGKTAADLFPPERAQAAATHQEQILAAGAPLEFEETVGYPDGPHPHLAVKFPLRDLHGKTYATAGISTDITARKQAEAALREARDQLEIRVQERTAELARATETLRHNERRFRALIEHGSDSIALISAENKILYLSPAVTAVEGYTPEELIGRSGIENTHPEDLPLLQEVVQKLLAQPGQPLPVLWRRRHKQGHWLWLEGVATNLLNDPAVAAIVTNYRDITERKQAEEARRASESRYRTLFDYAPDGIVIADPQSYYLDANASLCRMLGYSRAELIGKHASEIVAPAEIRHIGSALKVLQAKTDYQREWLFRRQDGSTFPADVIATQMPDGNLLAVIRDITQRKQAEALILESAERYHNVTMATDDVIWEWNLEANSLWWNENFQSAFGYRAPEISPGVESWTDNIHPQDRERVLHGIHAVIASGEKRWSDEYRFRRADGSFAFVLDRGFVIHGAAGQPVRMLGAMIDFTARKEAEEEIRKLNAELEQRVRQRTAELEIVNKELESFSYSVSHDLRAPLRHIDGFVDLLAKQNADKLDDRGRRYLGIITKAAHQMGNLIDDLLVFSRMSRTELRRKPVDLEALVHEAIAGMQTDLTGRDLIWKIAPLPHVQADAAMLRQVLVNLIGNAVKYTRPRQPAEIEIAPATPTATELVFFVRDNGVGFDMEYVNKLFGVFQRLHRAEEFEGTGIGLANVQRIILRHGGRVWAEGKIDAGATFYFTLPKSPED